MTSINVSLIMELTDHGCHVRKARVFVNLAQGEQLIMTQEALIPGHYLLQVLASDFLAEESKARIEKLIVSCGKSLEDLEQPRSKIPLKWVEHFVTVEKYSDPALLAFQFGSQVSLTSQGDLSMVLMTSPTIRDSFLVTQYLPLETNALSIDFIETKELALLFIDIQTGSELLDRILLFYTLGAIKKLMLIIGGQEPPIHIKVSAPKPKGFEKTIQKADQWQFNYPINCIIVNKYFLDTPGLFADPVSHQAAKRRSDAALEKFKGNIDICDKVRNLLYSETNSWDQNKIASALHMSRSTLKRHLAQRGSNFNQILNAVRKQKAIKYLLDSDFSVQEIAERLGYSDQSNFSHAFKKWTGMAPGEFREQQI